MKYRSLKGNFVWKRLGNGEKNMRKIFVILSVASIAFLGTACGQKQKDQNEMGVKNERTEDNVIQPLNDGVVNSDGCLDHLVPGIYKRSNENSITTVTLGTDDSGNYTIEIVNDITGDNSTGKTTVIDELYSVFDDMGEAYGVGRDPEQSHETILSQSTIDTSNITTQGYGCTYTPENGEAMLYISSLSDGSLSLSLTAEGEGSVRNQTGSEYGIQFMNGYFSNVSE